MGTTEDLGGESSLAVDTLTVRTSISAPGVSLSAVPVTAAVPADPVSTVSTSAVMAGTGVTFTPTIGTSAAVVISGAAGTQTGASICTVSARYGTGPAPANGATASSTGNPLAQAGIQCRAPAAAITPATPFTIASKITGLTIGTTYWLDLTYKTADGASAAVLGSLSFLITECQ